MAPPRSTASRIPPASTSARGRRRRSRSASWPRSSRCGAAAAERIGSTGSLPVAAAREEKDPVCGMSVTVEGARHTAEARRPDVVFLLLGLPREVPRGAGAVRGGIGRMRPEIQSLQEAMERQGYIAEPAIATAVFLALEMKKPLLIEGDAAWARPRSPRCSRACSAPSSSACSATRASTSTRRSTSGTTRSRCCACGWPSRRAARRPRSRRSSTRGRTCSSGRCCKAITRRDAPAGAARRRGRPRRRRLRGVPARGPLGLPGHDPGARHGDGRARAARHPHLQPDARDRRRPAPALPLPVHRAPRASKRRSASSTPACRE